jgi:hypothetical protein
VSTCVQPCLLCDVPVEVNTDSWVSKEAPLALCSDCCGVWLAGPVNWPLIRMIYMMRCQIGNLFQRVDLMDRQFREMVKTQQELDQELLGRRRAA